MAARAGHDLVLEAARWKASLILDSDAPGRSSVEAHIEVFSLEVREGTGGVKALTDADRDEIAGNLRKVLAAAEHPIVRFASSTIRPIGDDVLRLAGDLTIAGVTRPLTMELQVRPIDGEAILAAEVPVRQSTFGIKPFSAMMGTLKVADDVAVEVRARL